MPDRYDLKALYETSQLLSTSLEVNFVLENLLRVGMSKLLVTRGLALLFDPLKKCHYVTATKGISGLKKGDCIELDDTPEPSYLVEDEVPEVLAAHRIHLVLPVLAQNQHLGFLGFGRKATGANFSTQELEFIQSLVYMSSAAIQNALMVEKLRQTNHDLDHKIQRLNTLFDLATGFGSTYDREKVVKLLSFSLMGQMMIRRFAFLHRHSNSVDRCWFEVLFSTSGKTVLSQPLDEALCHQTNLVVLDDRLPADSIWYSLFEQGFRLLIPLRLQQETRGILCLGAPLNPQPLTQADLEFLGALGQLTLTSLENINLIRSRIEKEVLDEEIRLARLIQERLLPQNVLKFPSLEIAFRSIPSRQVSGDFFEIHAFDEKRILFAIADVTGKGVPASLLMSNLQACLQFLLTDPSPLNLPIATERINTVICDNTDPDKFITFFWGILDLETQVFQYVNAGHDPPLWFKTSGEVLPLETGGLLLGVFKGMPYQQGTIRLQQGDRLLLFTDGVTEAMNANMEPFSDERLVDLLKKSTDTTSEATATALTAALQAWSKAVPQSDDITFVLLKMREGKQNAD